MTTSEAPGLADRLSGFVARRASKLQRMYHADNPGAVAELAVLRRGASQRLGDDTRLIGLTIGGLYPETHGLPDEPTAAEHAAYAALTLFALHQQSHRDRSMHQSGYSFGRSARLLGRRSNARDAVRARFTAVATATSWDETLHHARGLVQQFRAQGVPLDYGRFARDLLFLHSPATADRVRLTWGRDYYRIHHPEDDGDTADVSDNDAAEQDELG